MKHEAGFVDLTGLFESWGASRKAIVDDVHYSPLFNRFLAQKVASHIDLNALIAGRGPADQARVTGRSRRSSTTGRDVAEH
jgi:hypothetical protein